MITIKIDEHEYILESNAFAGILHKRLFQKDILKAQNIVTASVTMKAEKDYLNFCELFYTYAKLGDDKIPNFEEFYKNIKISPTKFMTIALQPLMIAITGDLMHTEKKNSKIEDEP